MSLPPGSVRSDRSSSRPTPSRSGSISGPSSNSSSRHVLHQVAYPHQALHQDEHPPTLDQVLDTLATISDLLDSNNPFTAIDLLSHLMDAIATQCESLGLTSENFGDDMQLEGEDPAELRREFWTHLNSQWLKAVTLALKLDDGKQRSKASFSLSSPQNSSTLSSSIPTFSALTNNVTSTSPNSTILPPQAQSFAPRSTLLTTLQTHPPSHPHHPLTPAPPAPNPACWVLAWTRS
ncbi:hypothetical protein BC829DRAFT_297955 [Chytridium lagenaria]|nr:hypothetical protein BC829DRAFT_297955 [Chytridium lagenaria]